MSSPSSYLKKAREFESKKEWDKAIAEYRRILDSDAGGNAALYNLLGDLYAKKADLDQAFKNYEKAIELYCEETLYNNAIALCKKCLRVDAERVEIYGRLGGLYASQGLVHEAIRFLTEYADRKKGHGDVKAVETTWLRIIEIAPDNAALHARCADILLELKRSRAAVDALSSLAALLHRKGSHEEATAVEARSAELMAWAPNEEPMPAGGAVPQDLADAVDEIIKIDWSEIDVVGGGIGAAPLAGPLPASERHGAADVPADPRSGSVSVKERAQQEDDLVDLNEVLDEFRSGVAQVLDAGDYQGHYDLGMSYKEMELYDDAIASFRTAAEGAATRLPAIEMIGQCLVEKGNVREAIHHLVQALGAGRADDPAHVGLQYVLGNAYMRLNERDRALACYTAVVAVDPQFRDAEERLRHLQEFAR